MSVFINLDEQRMTRLNMALRDIELTLKLMAAVLALESFVFNPLGTLLAGFLSGSVRDHQADRNQRETEPKYNPAARIDRPHHTTAERKEHTEQNEKKADDIAYGAHFRPQLTSIVQPPL